MTVSLKKYVLCPRCNGDQLQEFAYRFTYQPVTGLQRNGDADDYDSYETGDDVHVVGFGCRNCDWWTPEDDIDFEPAGNAAIRALKAMPLASQPKPVALGRPVVLVHLDGDSYGGDSLAFPGSGTPLVITFDASRYDKFNRQPDADPAADYAEELDELRGHEAHATLASWVEAAAA